MGAMFGIELICTDQSCAEVSEAMVASLEEADVLTCDSCGCTLQSLAVWEVVELRPAAPVRALPTGRRHLPHAA
jgi:hypothetical protein